MSSTEQSLDTLIEVFSKNPFDKPRRLFKKYISASSIAIFDSDKVEKAFLELDWKSNVKDPYSILRTFEEGLSFPRDFLSIFSDEALLYYLPLFLAAIIISDHEADVIIDTLLIDFSSKPIYDKLSDPQKIFYDKVMAAYG